MDFHLLSAKLQQSSWLDVQAANPRSLGQRSRGQRKLDASSQTTPRMEHGDMPADLSLTNNSDNSDESLVETHNGWNSAPKNNATRGGLPPPIQIVCEPLQPPVSTPISTPSVAIMEQDVLYLRQELSAAREQIRKLQDQDKQLRERLAGQVQQQFQLGNEQFEDVSLGPLRPAELIRRYGDLYLDSRVEALDALDRLTPLRDLDVLKLKILFSVIVLSFKATQQSVGELRGRLRHILSLPVRLSTPPPPPNTSQQQQQQQQHQHHDHQGLSQQPPPPPPQQPLADVLGKRDARERQQDSPSTAAAVQMELHITEYLCQTADTFEVAEIVFEVCQQIYATLYDYPCLKACAGLLDYVSQCVRVGWGLCVQRQPYTITYESPTFQAATHARFHTSDPDNNDVKSYLWPALLDFHGGCVSRAVVIT